MATAIDARTARATIKYSHRLTPQPGGTDFFFLLTDEHYWKQAKVIIGFCSIRRASTERAASWQSRMEGM